jgi:hypothetical protein
MRRNFPTGNDVSFLGPILNAKTNPSGRSRTCASSPRCSTAAFANGRIALKAGAVVERHSYSLVIPHDLTRRRTRLAFPFPGRPRPLVVTPRGHIRPDKRGRERPPSERARGRLPGVAEGVAHAPSSLSIIIRAVSAAAQSAAAFPTTARAHPLVRQRVAASASSERRHHHHHRSAVQFSGLKGGQLRSEALSPLLSPVPLCEGWDKLTLTLTATRGRAR